MISGSAPYHIGADRGLCAGLKHWWPGEQGCLERLTLNCSCPRQKLRAGARSGGALAAAAAAVGPCADVRMRTHNGRCALLEPEHVKLVPHQASLPDLPVRGGSAPCLPGIFPADHVGIFAPAPQEANGPWGRFIRHAWAGPGKTLRRWLFDDALMVHGLGSNKSFARAIEQIEEVRFDCRGAYAFPKPLSVE